VVHIHGWGYRLARTVARAAQADGTPYVISPHGALSDGAFGRRAWRDRLRGLLVENRLIRKAAAVTGLNDIEDRDLRSRCTRAKIVQLPYGVAMSEYEREATVPDGLPNAPAGRCLLILGPLHPAEGLVPLLKAFAEIASDFGEWSVVMAGREIGEWRKMLEAAIRRKGGEGRVIFAPASDLASQRSWLARASVLASPALHVRFPVSIMQAVASGVPVLATNRVAPPGLEGTIHVCGPRRSDLKVALEKLLSMGDEERASLAQRARDVGRSALDWPVIVDRYAQLYQDLANRA
jgi:glycosyltransferase involved in cell wall biosynthesis